ncbi:MAG TPA: site-specific integrase, partial [Saprospiraceae bacterium]|nr:site-specific integrase [Saprospiraceae bacterium]
ENEQISSRCKAIGNVTRLNNLIHKRKTDILDKLMLLEEEGALERFSLTEIKDLLVQKNSEIMFLEWTESIILQLKESGRFGNARIYDTLLRSIRLFEKGKDISFKRISFSWLKKYEAWYLARGNSLNGLSVNMRTLRALYNRAIAEKILSKEYYPFEEYKIRSETTRKRAIPQTSLSKILNFEPKTERQRRAKSFFMISFYMMGASFVDLAFMKLSNIKEGRIEYKRKKTGHLHSIVISEPLKKLFKPYLKGKGADDFILDIIKTSDSEKQVLNVRDELRRYNRSLKDIGEICQIETELTSYVSRHTYATVAKHLGVPTAIISESLGHSSEDVTQIYLDSFNQEVLDDHHFMIINSI